ncbi:MAG TPA: PIN domain-containing protein [Tepidisphaeraceae bacterium]|jgi:PIN domain nuclease of toxin-antitoxin system
MRFPIYSLDTHVQYWQIAAPAKLSIAARTVFDNARSGRAVLIISHIVIAELFYLFQKQGQSDEFAPFIRLLETSPAYRVEPITMEDLKLLPKFHEIPEMHDRLIAIQASRLDAILVTKDSSIRASAQVKTLW